MMREYLPTKTSIMRSCVIVGMLLCMYLMDDLHIASYLGSKYKNIIKPMLCIATASVIYMFPKIHPVASLKLKESTFWWVFNFSIIFVIISLLSGLSDGFGKSPYSRVPMGMISNVIIVGSMLVAKEFARSYLVNSLTRKENYFIFIAVALFMTITEFPFIKYSSFKEPQDTVIFFAQYFLPEFSQNLLSTYLVFLGGPSASIIYMGIFKSFHWLSPILPNMQWITAALIGILCPVFSLSAIQNFYLKESRALKKNDKNNENPLSWAITCVFSIGIIWFAVGVFKVYPSVIATGSMEPMIKPGDMILVEKINKISDINNIKVGDVLQFKREDILISHRIIEIVEQDDGKSYRTKGDNNSGPDIQLLKTEKIRGKIIGVVPKIGWPTLLIKSRKEITVDQIEF